MFGSERRVRAPVLLILVFGVLLVLVGITATAQAVMVSAYASTSALSSIVDGDVATVRGFVQDGLHDLDLEAPDPAVVSRINDNLQTLLAKGGIAYAEIRGVDGRVIAASTSGSVGAEGALSPDFVAAVGGTPRVGIVGAAEAEALAPDLPPTVLREYLPLQQDGVTLLVIGIWRDAGPVMAQLDELRRNVVTVTLTAAIVAAAVLFLVFRTAQTRINRQTTALLYATRLDALTQTLNHGALVGHLAEEIERARTPGGSLGVALIDVDNFRLLNDNHGHRAGDDALLIVAGAVQEELPDGAVMGRYGPDEFLLVGSKESATDLDAIAQRIRASLAGQSLQFAGTERLPLTVSVGISMFPEHGSSVTELLSTTASTLLEAKTSGGDAVRIAGADATDQQASVANFDVLQGLVLAVDTKDRYTKRHSEDVARYGVFLAEQLELDAATIHTIHAAGLLHDIGKIGVPDVILRKPGRLTADELDVIKQHVALGNLIVRDLPDIETIRAGIRYHHERWDGRGYLEELAGEDIPMIGRILAVADAFSAMTTTRPYRKALDVGEALNRLGDAAGTQLDESLVEVFIRGIESVAGAPLPGGDTPSLALWRPRWKVA